jgi:hypothetical protein
MLAAEVYVGGVLPSLAAVPYDVDGKRVHSNTSAYPGNGDVLCTAHDLLQFAMFHLKDHLPDQRAVLSDDGIDLMQGEDGSSNGRYELGWSIDVDDNGLRSAYHGGHTTGAGNFMRLIPSQDLALVILCNTELEASKLLEIQRAIVAAVIPEHGEVARQSTAAESGDDGETETAKPAESEEVRPPEPRFPEELQGTWHGKIVAHDREIQVTLVIGSDMAQITLAGQDQYTVDFSVVTPSFLLGTFPGEIPAQDIARYEQHVRLALLRGEDGLSGQATAVGWRDDRKTSCELSSWIALKSRGASAQR